MSTEAISQISADAAADSDLINYEADGDAMPEVDWTSTNIEGEEMGRRVESNDFDWKDPDDDGGTGEDHVGKIAMGFDATVGYDGEDDANADEVEASMSTAVDRTQTATDEAAGISTHDDANEADEVDEITYDEGDGLADGGPRGPVRQAEEDLIDYESFPEGIPAGQDDGGPSGETKEGAEFGGDAGDASAREAQDESGNEADTPSHHDAIKEEPEGSYEDSDQSQDNQEPPPVKNEEYPDITVCYKNDVFPLFHGQSDNDSSMGFFDDADVLDFTMDGLLSSFRHEISAELGPQDEVVFQVDELGLEYSESTQREHLTGATLRQLHEIFDQLAKNDDPDSSRTLYTNLIIRPSSAKRLELLIEEAFSGKGLEDVRYCFPPTASHSSSHRDANQEAKGVYQGDDAEIDGGSSADDGDEDDSPQSANDQGQSPDDDSRQDDLVDEDAEDVGMQNDYVVEVDNSTQDQTADDEVGDGDLFDDALDDAFDARDGQGVVSTQYDDEFQIVEAGEATTDKAFGDNGGEYNTDDLAGDDGGAEQAIEDTGFDLGDLIDEDAVAEGEDLDYTGRITPNTSATATLNGDNEINYEEDDVGVGIMEFPAETGTQTQDEIDWTNFTEVGNDSKSALPTGKRPRSEEEDELDLDDGTGVKRRRS